MNAYVIPAFTMAWPKVKSVLIHAALVALGIVAVAVEQGIAGYAFPPQYQAIAMLINTTVFKYIQKWFTDHGVVVNS